jgi:ribosomal protein S18 acetylase RimI-like enzyme
LKSSIFTKGGKAVRIRKITREDAEDYWKLRLRALKEYPDAFGSLFEEAKDRPFEKVKERLNTAPDDVILGAFSESGELIGMIGFIREKTKKMRHKAKIWGVYVVPEHQGGGVGKALLQEVLRHAAGLTGLERIQLTVASHNQKAKALYAQFGFQVYGLEKKALKLEDRYIDEEMMEYEL